MKHRSPRNSPQQPSRRQRQRLLAPQDVVRSMVAVEALVEEMVFHRGAVSLREMLAEIRRRVVSGRQQLPIRDTRIVPSFLNALAEHGGAVSVDALLRSVRDAVISAYHDRFGSRDTAAMPRWAMANVAQARRD